MIKVIGEPVLKLNTGILKCQIPKAMKHQVQIVSWKFGNNFIYPTKSWPKGKWTTKPTVSSHFEFSDLDLVMVPSGELHITSVDYKHTHHPYFCIVKHLNSGNSQESLPFHLTLRGKGWSRQNVTINGENPIFLQSTCLSFEIEIENHQVWNISCL